jgi:hypothetical protein
VGFPVATITNNATYFQQTQGPGTAAGCSSNVNPGEERFEMSRSWNLDMGGGAPIGSYDVRFYYQPSERTAIETAAINHMASYPACGYTYKYATPLGFFWFKNSGSNYTAPQYDLTQYSATIASTINGVNYSQWNGIPGFSGGSGAVILIPISVLPIELTSFAAICEESTNLVSVQWVTASEQNTSHYTIERSIDGINWELIGEQGAAGNSTNSISYQFIDNQVREFSTIYYRLNQFDLDGAKEQFGPISVECGSIENGFKLFPNPAGNNVTAIFTGEISEGSTSLSFYDLNGKVVKKVDYQKDKIMNISLDEISPGCYFVRMENGFETIETVKFIKQ